MKIQLNFNGVNVKNMVLKQEYVLQQENPNIPFIFVTHEKCNLCGGNIVIGGELKYSVLNMTDCFNKALTISKTYEFVVKQ